jgi:ABC-type bacteriocin/lantibiotic exporter with double-glycine peptidase domain
MIVDHTILAAKRQTKMMDCWYACIQMIKSSVMGAKTKPGGAVMLVTRKKNDGIKFGEATGTAVLAENGLIDISNKIKLDKMMTLAKALETYGPVIVCGMFAFFNKYGHCIVISGCDTDTGVVTVYDPGWFKGKQSKSWDYIKTHLHKIQGDANTPAAGAVVANKPDFALDINDVVTRTLTP